MPPTTGLPQRRPLPEADPSVTMASLVGRDDSAERVIGAIDTPLRQLVGDAYRDKDFGSLAMLATGGVPEQFVEPLAHHLETSRRNGAVGGGFEVVGWMRNAARSRFERLVAENRPEGVHPQLETDPHAVRGQRGSVANHAGLPATREVVRPAVDRATARSTPAAPPTSGTNRPTNRADSTGPRSDRTFGLQLHFGRSSSGKHHAKSE